RVLPLVRLLPLKLLSMRRLPARTLAVSGMNESPNMSGVDASRPRYGRLLGTNGCVLANGRICSDNGGGAVPGTAGRVGGAGCAGVGGVPGRRLGSFGGSLVCCFRVCLASAGLAGSWSCEGPSLSLGKASSAGGTTGGGT